MSTKTEKSAILEPCCKIKQFNQIIQNLHRSADKKTVIRFFHYGDVSFTDWFTLLMLEAKGSDVSFNFKQLNLPTFNYILNRMQDHAFIPGKSLHLFNHVTISAKNMPEYIPLRAKVLQEEGRLCIKTPTRTCKTETITFTPSGSSKPKFILRGNFFADRPNIPRHIQLTQLSTLNSQP